LGYLTDLIEYVLIKNSTFTFHKEAELKIRENPIVYLAEKLWKYSEGNRKKIVLYLAMSWLSNMVHLCIPLLFALLLNEIQKNGVKESNIHYLLFITSLFIVRSCVGWALHGPSRVIEQKNAFMVRVDYKFRFLTGVLALPMRWHNEHHSGDTNDKLEKGSSGIFNFAENTFRVLLIVNSLIASFFILLFIDVASAFVALVMMLATIALIVVFDKRLAPQYRELSRMENKISEKILDVITNINTVVILRIEKLLLKSIKTKLLEPYKLYVENNKLNEIKWFCVSLCVNIMVYMILSYYLLRVYWGLPFLFGTVVALYGYAGNVADMFFELAGFFGDLLKYKARVLNAEELASEFNSEEIVNNGNGKHKNWRILKVKSLNFSYHTEEGADLHLEDVSFEVKNGSKIAVIGHTGSGKSTLLAIIKCLFQPQEVELCLDHLKVPEGFVALKTQVALVPQDPDIFAKSIYENISFGDYGMDVVKKYSDIACFTEVAEKLPKKWESIINERGVNLSGGEKQRLALARGLLFACEDKLEPKSIVLLDEPTSSIDVATELQIYRNIFSALSDKTIISSIHRLHLLPMFDQIYFFENGKIIAGGTFGELLKNSKEFQELWSKYNSALSKAAK